MLSNRTTATLHNTWNYVCAFRIYEYLHQEELIEHSRSVHRTTQDTLEKGPHVFLHTAQTQFATYSAQRTKNQQKLQINRKHILHSLHSSCYSYGFRGNETKGNCMLCHLTIWEPRGWFCHCSSRQAIYVSMTCCYPSQSSSRPS
jgi:hypothetical protein